MNELLNQIQGQWAFAFGLVVAFPRLLVALNELALKKTVFNGTYKLPLASEDP